MFPSSSCKHKIRGRAAITRKKWLEKWAFGFRLQLKSIGCQSLQRHWVRLQSWCIEYERRSNRMTSKRRCSYIVTPCRSDSEADTRSTVVAAWGKYQLYRLLLVILLRCYSDTQICSMLSSCHYVGQSKEMDYSYWRQQH